MEGTIKFSDPVNLRIQGSFKGTLLTKGQLTVGEKAHVEAHIEGDTITIAGRVTGKVIARERLTLTSTGRCVGEVRASKLSVEEGGILDGRCKMPGHPQAPSEWSMTAKEAAKYLELDVSTLLEWAADGHLPAITEGNDWKFDKATIEAWTAEQRLNLNSPR